MKALLCKAYGVPSDLVLEDVPSPEPGPGMVRIAVEACGVNFPDVLMIAGKYQVRPPLPFSPGAEVAGFVDAVGPGVRGLQVGQRVLALPGHGGMAEQVCVAEGAVVPMPDEMPFDTAAGFLLAYGTAQHALKQRAQLARGESLVVLGAAGGVGLAAVEFGRIAGARVIAAASSQAKLDLASQYGAVAGINYLSEPLRDRIIELTGRGADVVYDPVGGDFFEPALRALGWKGRLLVIGFASGRIPQVPANLPLLKGTSIVGVYWGRFAQEEPAAYRDNLAELMALWRRGELRPHISGRYGLDRAAEAIAVVAGRQALGKVIVTV